MIVVVDDDSALANLIVVVARRCGDEARAFPTGDEALAFIRKDPLQVTVALADLATGGRGGDWLADEVRRDETLRHIRVFLLSGDREIEAKAEACGAAGWLRKPFSIAELEKVVRGA
jgi:CheY-like chemotaxis protein